MTGESSGDVRQIVRSELWRLKRRESEAPSPIGDDDGLKELGVGSLDLLELTDALETALHVNPFDQGASLKDVRTVEDLCRVYEAALDGRVPESAGDGLLQRSRERAAARRRQSAG